MVMGDFNASVSDKLTGVVGPYKLGSRASDNHEILVTFACANGLGVMNTFFYKLPPNHLVPTRPL